MFSRPSLSVLQSYLRRSSLRNGHKSDAVRSAGLNAKSELRKSGNVKPNEALGKQKPRLVLSGGDQGVISHIFDAGVLEGLLFHMDFFESRSIKHTDFGGLVDRMAKMAQRYDMTASLDFGAFDGSLGKTIRTEVEKSFLESLLSHLIGACDLTTQALSERIKDEFIANVMKEARLKVDEKIRESGDRGTSILNYLTNLVAFLAVTILLMKDRNKSKEMISKIIEDFFANRGGLFDIIEEGDDGQHFFRGDVWPSYCEQ